MSAYWLWDLDPVFLDLGGVEVRYYGLCFFAMFVTGYTLWRAQMQRGGHAIESAARIIPYGVLGVVLGGRLVHCLFYEPDYYLSHPLQILNLHSGGLASHGSVLGILVGLRLYSWRYQFSFLEVIDRLAYALMPAGAFVRLGNFLNAEIVGTEWDGLLAIRFQYFAARLQSVWESGHGVLGWVVQPLPRHPVQLYEGAGMLAIFAVVWGLDRRIGERRPMGLMTGLVLTLYFGFRLGIENFKEYQRFMNLELDTVNRVIHVLPSSDFTMGQWLSLPGLLFGLAFIAYAMRTRKAAAVASPSDPQPVV